MINLKNHWTKSRLNCTSYIFSVPNPNFNSKNCSAVKYNMTLLSALNVCMVGLRPVWGGDDKNSGLFGPNPLTKT